MAKYDSIGLAGAGVGTLQLTDKSLDWSPRHEADADAKSVSLDQVLRASWSPIGKMCHMRLFCKNGERPRYDGFRRSDMEGLTAYFEAHDIDFEKESVASGGSNFGTIDFEGSGTLSLRKGGAQMFELNLSDVATCMAPGNKADELDVTFVDSAGASREGHQLFSMRLWVPGQKAPDMQTRILAQAADMGTSSGGPPLVEFDRDQGTFVLPKNRYAVEMYEAYFRMIGTSQEFKVKYSDVSRYYMLEKPTGHTSRSEPDSDVHFFYFVICLERPVRLGQQSYAYLVWQTINEESEVAITLEEDEIEAKYPGAGLKPSMEGALHKSIGKLFKVLSGKTVFAGSRKYRSAAGHQCVSCNLGQRNGVLYPNDKSFVFLHQPTMVIEYSEVAHVEFVKAQETRSFEFIVAKKASAGGKTFKFGAIEKKEFNALAEFVKSKEAFFTVRNYQPEEEAADDDSEDDEEDDDFGSEDGKASGSSSSDSDDTGKGSDDDEAAGSGDDEVMGKAASKKAPKSPSSGDAKKGVPSSSKAAAASKASPKKKKKKDPNAPKGPMSAYMLFGNYMRGVLKEQSPDLSFTEVGKELGVRWKDMDETAKKEWQEKAEADKQRHAAEMADYEPPSGDDDDEEDTKKGKKRKAAKDPNAPKKPMGAYFLWMAETRAATKAANSEATTGELSKIMGAEWKALGEEEKAKFNAKAQEETAKYKKAVAQYKGGAEAPTSMGKETGSMDVSDAEAEVEGAESGADEDEDSD